MPYTVPFGPVSAEVSDAHDDAPTVLSFCDAYVSRELGSLLDEAIDLACRLGCHVDTQAARAGSRCFWVRGRLRLLLDPQSPATQRLAVIAEALRGDHRLSDLEMSSSLAEYLQPRRAA